MTLAGPAFEFEAAATVALGGSDFGAGLPLWTAVEIAAGQTIRFGATRSGARACLAVRGGLAVKLVMGSASVHVVTGVGGRPLRKGDVLEIGEAAVRRARAGAPPPFAMAGPLRVTAGPQADRFAAELYAAAYTVSEESNRMGLRLRGPAIPSPPGGMLTEGVPLGAVQVPPDGQPIILFVDHQTTGGYPKPANVISADFWRLGQLRPRDEVRVRAGDDGRRAPAASRSGAMAVLAASRRIIKNAVIDLNCDMGELEDAAHEAALMEHITSANIACGGHAGDEATMERTARLALARGVRIGAHPGYPDRANFGRWRCR